MSADLKNNVKRADTWLRGLFMLLFAIVVYSVAEIVMLAVVVFQFLHTLFAGKPNAQLLQFGSSLSSFMYQVFRYLTDGTDERPFPFAPWPTSADATGNGNGTANKAATTRSAKTSKTAKTSKETDNG